jgi:thiol-disulfide isomerase/thioredoxin
MKKSIKIILSLITLSALIFLVISIILKITSRNNIATKIETIPKFSFLTIDTKIIANTDIVKNNVLINYFNPSCNHCQYMATEIKKNISHFAGVELFMITGADSLATVQFIKAYQLENIEGIHVLRDTKDEFEAIFGTSVVPSFFIYQNRKLTIKIIGETKIENLINATREEATP